MYLTRQPRAPHYLLSLSRKPPSPAAVLHPNTEVPLRQYIVLIGSLCLTLSLLTGCGNGNDGRPLTPNKRKLGSTQTTTNPVGTTDNTQAVQLDYCKTFTPVDASPAASLFGGAQVCKIRNTPTVVRIKVSGNFPLGGRFCVVPMTNDGAHRESCFAINGQADVALDPNVASYGYGSMAMINEGDLSAYRAFLNFQSTVSPPRGITFMNQ